MSYLLSSVIKEPRRKIVFVYPDVKVSQCCELMAANDIGSLVVIDEENLVGILSERDVIRNCLCKGLDINETQARDIAYADVSIMSIHDTLEQAMEEMIHTKRRHLLIKEQDQITAILSIGDILFNLLDDRARVIEQLEHYINH